MNKNTKFGTLLSKAIRRVAASENQLIGVLQDEIGFHLGRKGRASVERWRKGYLPPSTSDVEKLARELARRNGFADFTELRDFLVEARHPYPQLLCGEVFPTTLSQSQNESSHPPIPPQRNVPFLAPPRSAIDLIGRNQLLSRLKRVLFGKSNLAISALKGIPGVGKTALAVALAHDVEIQRRFKDGILWVGLGRSPDIQSLYSYWAYALGIPSKDIAQLSSNTERAKHLQMVIGARRMLLVIDDAWNVGEALAFKLGGRNSAHILTTRNPIIASEFAGKQTLYAGELSQEDSIHLLTEVAPSLNNEDTSRLAELSYILGNLPLALILGGKLYNKNLLLNDTSSLDSLLQQLQDAKSRLRLEHAVSPLEQLPSLAQFGQLSLQAAIQLSDEHLSPEAQALLRGLEVFLPKPNTFSTRAALEITDASSDALDELHESGLLELAGGERFTLHQSISDYTQLYPSAPNAQQRFVSHYSAFTQENSMMPQKIEPDLTNVIQALTFAEVNLFRAEFVKLTINMQHFYSVRGLYDIAVQTIEKAEKWAAQLESGTELSNLLAKKGRIVLLRGNYAEANQLFEEGLDLAQTQGNAQLVGAHLVNLGRMNWQLSNFDVAQKQLLAGLEKAKSANNVDLISNALSNLGAVCTYLGELDDAEAYFHESLKYSSLLDDQSAVSAAYNGLGTVAIKKGDFAAGETYFHNALGIVRAINHREQMSALLWNIGAVASERQDYPEAQLYLEEALQISRELMYHENIGFLLSILGTNAQRLQQFDASLQYQREAESVAKQLNNAFLTAQVANGFGELYLELNRVTEAQQAFEDALQLFREMNAPENIANELHALARVAYADGRLTDASRLGNDSLSIYKEIGHSFAAIVENWMQTNDILAR